jgi:hypothetical protein
MIGALAAGDDYEPARSWINRHSSELVSLHPLLVAIAPESTTAILRNGYILDLKLGDLANWNIAALVIRRLSIVDKELASIVLKTNHQGIAQGFVLRRHDCNYKGLPEFLDLMCELAPDILKECLESLDPTTIRISWAERLKGKSKRVNGKAEERQAAEALLNLIIDKDITSLVDVSHDLKNYININYYKSIL